MRRLIRAVLDTPAERYIHGAMLVVLAVAFVTSFESGSEGARTLGYPAGFEAALPLVCDVVAGVATVIHSQVRNDDKMRRLAAQFVLGPMLLSWGANAVDHVKAAPADSGWLPWAQAAWVVGVVLAAGICPVAVAALLHLSTKYAEYKRRQAERAEKRTPQKKWVVAAIEERPDGQVIEHVVEAPSTKADEQDGRPQLRVAGEPRPWSGRAQELIDQGVPRATAYRRARKEHTGGNS